MKVDFINLNAQYQEIKQDIEKGLEAVFNKGNFILGEEVKRFEDAFAKYCGCSFGVGVNSGTDALFLGLLSLGIGPGDEVIVPAFTFIATALAVSYTGARVVFADINEETYNIDVKKIEKAITKNTKAIIPVHLFGQPADMGPIMAVAKRNKLKVIEDACQAHGAKYKNRRVGSIGDIGCFSFYPTKNLGAFGDGGIAVTNNKKIYEKLLILHDCGRKIKGSYEHIIKGYNSRLDTSQAVILIAKLKHLDKWNRMRQKNAGIYSRLLKNAKDLIIPYTAKNGSHIFHIYAIRVKNRDAVLKQLRSKGIGASIYYPLPLHLQKAYKELGCRKGDFPVSEKISSDIIALPMSAHLTKEKISFVAKTVKELTNGR